ncbi:MAG: dihydrodipicolinate synthase family protein, partial [Planctomycetia bacterium]|nr:dihydrodipicolinate synthase family protein [Planctomycetia bacterium]
DYFCAIADAISLPVIVQDASSYVGRPMSIAMQARLFERFGPRVMYKPEAAPPGPRLTQLRDATGGQAAIFEGSGGLALVESFRRGIAGTMPGTEVVDAIVALWRALQAGDPKRIEQLSQPLCALVSLQGSLDAFLAIEKHILRRRGVFKNTLVRGPVGYVLDGATRREVDRLLDRLLAAVAS